VLVGETLLESQGWSTLLAGQVVRTESSPVISGRRTFEQLLASRSANFRQQVRRRERKLRREHGLRLRLCDGPARLQEDLDLLFDLHARRWDPEESTAFDERRAAFHREFAALALERGWLRLWVAEADGRPVAALYGWRFGDSECFYQSGRDPAWAREAVGFVLLAHAVGAALDDGVAEYRLLRGAEAYKRRFADHDPGLETVIVPRRSVTGAAASVVAALAERERPRRWLGRLAASTSP
jgi:CelD/BcsL family acetyltransferase involved in cellulose biosynthesis